MVLTPTRARPATAPVASFTPAHPPGRPRLLGPLRPGWPLTGLLVGYPLWWLLGIAQILVPVAAVLMALDLIKMRQVRVQRGFGCWLLFLAWLALGIVVLQVAAPGALPTHSTGRYLTYSFRCCLYLSATIVPIYIYNMRDRLSTTRIVRAFGWFFVTVVAGGVLGTLTPELDFPSAVELVLPHGATHVQFIHDLVHPVVAQLHSVNGVVNPRASAPFAFTNGWGLAFACLLPFFLVGWFGPQAGWRRQLGPMVLVISVYPVIMSQNRGLWLALVISGVIICIRAAIFGNVKFAVGMLAAAALAVGVILSTPLGGTIEERLSNSGSETGRSNLGNQTVASVSEGSPIVGLGTTRNVQGSFYSIAGGDTSACDGCSPPPLGTQGHFWLVIYSTGYGGLALYFGFILLQLFRHIRLRSPVATLGLVVIVAHLSTMLVYDTIGIGLVIIFAAIGLLWREARSDLEQREPRPRADPTVMGYVRLVRANRLTVAVCLILGLIGGLAYQKVHGARYDATAAVLVPIEPRFADVPSNAQTMDTIAQLINAPEVAAAAGRVVGQSIAPGDARLKVTARANTRVLQIHFSAHSLAAAEGAAQAAGQALLQVRAALLRGQATDALKSLQDERKSALAAAATIAKSIRADRTLGASLFGQENGYLNRVQTIDVDIMQINSTPAVSGSVIGVTAKSGKSDARKVDATSGLGLGLVLAMLIALARHIVSERAGRRREGYFGALRVLARLPEPGRTPSRSARRYPPPADDRPLAMLGPTGVSAVLNADFGDATRRATRTLDRLVPSRPPHRSRSAREPDHVVLVAGHRTRLREIERVTASLELSGAEVTGLVLVGQSLAGRAEPRRRRLPWPVREVHQETWK